MKAQQAAKQQQQHPIRSAVDRNLHGYPTKSHLAVINKHMMQTRIRVFTVDTSWYFEYLIYINELMSIRSSTT